MPSDSPRTSLDSAAFAVELVLDPAPEDLETLRRWTSGPLVPDYLVVTAGFARFLFGGVPIAYRDGRYLPLRPDEPLPAGATDRLTDFVGGFAQRLADALIEVPSAGSTIARMIDSPAGLWLASDGDQATVAYRERASGPDLRRAEPRLAELRAACRSAIERFVASILALNPALAGQSDVARLRRSAERL